MKLDWSVLNDNYNFVDKFPLFFFFFFKGLLSCSITLALKADILTTLTAFAKSKETAALLWNNLEVSQIISTMPTTKVYSE